MNDIIQLGEYCVRNHITLQDLQLFSNELIQYRTKNLDTSKKHFQNYKKAQNGIWISGNLEIDTKQGILKKEGTLCISMIMSSGS